MKELGVTSVKSEVDLSNKRVVKSIKLMEEYFWMKLPCRMGESGQLLNTNYRHLFH